MRVVADTSILQQAGYRLRGGKWPLILSAARRQLLELSIPEVVVREFVAHYRNDLRKGVNATRRGRAELRRLGADDLAGPDIDDTAVDVHLHEYEEWVRGTLKRSAEILPIPGVDHGLLVDRILHRRKPFSEGEKGYRDALIWHSVVKAAENGPLRFAVGDVKDFLDEERRGLSPDLVGDLDAASVPVDNIQLILQVGDLVGELLPEDENARAIAKEIVERSDGLQTLQDLADEFFGEGRVGLSVSPGVLPRRLIDPDIETLDIHDVDIDSAHPSDGESALVIGTARGSAYVGGLVFAREMDEDDWLGWEAWDFLADQFYMAYEEPQPVTVEFSVVLAPSRELSDFYVERAGLSSDHLQPHAAYEWSSRPATDDILTHIGWLQSQFTRLRNSDRREFARALMNPSFIQDLTEALQSIEPAVIDGMTSVESIPLSPDNLPSVLEERGGIAAAQAALALLKHRIEDTESQASVNEEEAEP